MRFLTVAEETKETAKAVMEADSDEGAAKTISSSGEDTQYQEDWVCCFYCVNVLIIRDH